MSKRRRFERRAELEEKKKLYLSVALTVVSILCLAVSVYMLITYALSIPWGEMLTL